MKWSWRIGRMAGIDLYLHATFLVLLGWFGLYYYHFRHSYLDAFNGLVFIGTIFFIVILHELGHALTARRFGIETHDITLLPIGGVARLERMPDNPSQELAVALAGPAVNVIIALVLFVLLGWSSALTELTSARLVGAPFMHQLLKWNLAMAVFNLIPAFPMDGGRVLRACLSFRLGRVRATRTAATVGQALALVGALAGLLAKNPYWVLIAVFVWMGASSESSLVQFTASLGGISIQQMMITDFRVLAPGDALSVAVSYIQSGFQRDFPVVENGRILGFLARCDLIKALPKFGQAAFVGDVMRRQFDQAAPTESAQTVFDRLQEGDCHSMPVVEDGQVLGLATVENLGEFLLIQAALRGERPGKMAASLAR